MIKNPPKFSILILRFFLRREEYLEKSGDLEEVYSCLVEEIGPFRARVWFWFQVLKAMPVFIINSICWRMIMFKNYWKISFRNLIRQKKYSIINITGLEIAFACVILIFLFVQYEFSFDSFHKNKDRIYRIFLQDTGHFYKGSDLIAVTPFPLAPALMDELSEIKYATRVDDESNVLIQYDKISLFANGLYADEFFLKMFRKIPI